MTEAGQDGQEQAAAAEGWVGRVGRRRQRPMQGVLLYIMLGAAAALCLQLTSQDPVKSAFFSAILGSAVAMGTFWIGFTLLNPVGVGGILGICLMLSAAGHHPSISVALLAASGLAGAVGARLTRLELEEDDFFFLPLLAFAGAMALLITLGAGHGWGEVLRRAGVFFGEMSGKFEKMVREAIAAGKAPENLNEEALGLFFQYFALEMTTMLTIVWALALWLTGRLARRRLGRLRGFRQSLFMFRIQQRYIFLLILGLILEIFSSLGWSQSLSYCSWPILGAIALAGFLEGLGIILFLAMVRRMSGQTQLAFWITALGVILAVKYWYIIALVGLADVWFDFRKLERLRRQMEEGAQDQKE